MLQGKYLSENRDQVILPVIEETLAELKQKHPSPAPIQQNFLMHGSLLEVPTIYFNSIDETTIKKAAKLTKGAAGPS